VVCCFPGEWAESPDKCLESWYVRAPMLLTMGLSGTPSLCVLGSPYNLGGLEPAGHNCPRVSSVSEDFLSSNVVFRSIASVGSWSVIYMLGPPEEIFCL